MMPAQRTERNTRPAAPDRRGLLPVLLAFLAVFPAAQAAAAPLENVGEIGPALLRCWHPPAAPDGSAVTLRFSFRRDGSLMGAPRVTYVGVDGGEQARRAFADSAVRAILQCAPLELSPRFAATIGGKVYVMQFAVRQKKPVVRQMYACEEPVERRPALA